MLEPASVNESATAHQIEQRAHGDQNFRRFFPTIKDHFRRFILHSTSSARIMKTLVVFMVFLYAFQVQAFRLPGLGHLRKTDNEYPTMDIWKFLTAVHNHVAGYWAEDQAPKAKDERKHKHRHGHGDHGSHTTKIEGLYIDALYQGVLDYLQ